MVENTSIINLVGLVQDPLLSKAGDQTTPAFASGRSNEILVSELRGKYATANDRGHVFTQNVTAQTIGVVSASYVSRFSLWLPSNATVNMELIDCNIGCVLAPIVINAFGLYYTQAAPTTTTAVGVLSGIVGGTGASQATFYSNATAAGTPARFELLASIPSTTGTTSWPPTRLEFDGKIIVPPGTWITLAVSTAAETTSAVDFQLRWLEYKNQ